jgi:hypothetical protein
MIYSTNTSVADSSPAIKIDNDDSTAVFIAPVGGIVLENGAEATAVAASRVHLSNNATLSYDPSSHDPTNMRFTVAPAGTWRMADDGWREIR